MEGEVLDFSGDFKAGKGSGGQAPASLVERLRSGMNSKPNEPENARGNHEGEDNEVVQMQGVEDDHDGTAVHENEDVLNAYLGEDAEDPRFADEKLVDRLMSEQREALERAKLVEESSHRTRLDLERVKNEKENLELQLQCAKQDIGALETKISVLQRQYKKEKARTESHIKELNVKISKLEGQHKQRQAASNKRESEYERLKKRMQMLQAQKDRSIKRSIELDKPLTPGNTKAFTVAQYEERLEEITRDSSTSQLREALEENSKLRAALEVKLQQMNDNVNELIISDDEIPSLSGDEIVARMNRLETKIGDLESENDLAECLKQAKQVIMEQDLLLKATIFGPTLSPSLPHNTEFDVEEQAEIERERELLQASERRLREERLLLQEQAQILDNDRIKFEQERFQQRILSSSPPLSTAVMRNSPMSAPIPPTPATKSLLRKIGITEESVTPSN